ncbi:MAG: helix-turn-helix domain-containing protein [Nanoarchaeota archaeon]
MEDALRTLGLSESERKVYLACLKLDKAKASTIAEHAKIERQASYYTLRQLIKRGLVTETIKSGISHYSCVNPNLLLDNIEEERLIKEKAIKELAKNYQDLRGVAIPKPKVELYEGLEGFKTAARELISGQDKEVYTIISEKIITFRPVFLEPYISRRIEKGIRAKVITEETQLLTKLKKEKKALRQVRFMDRIIKGKDYEMAITKDKVIFLRATDKEQIGIKIEDPSFAELQANIFKILWEQAKN